MLAPNPQATRVKDPADGRCAARQRKDYLAKHLQSRHGLSASQAEAEALACFATFDGAGGDDGDEQGTGGEEEDAADEAAGAAAAAATSPTPCSGSPAPR